MSNIMYMEKNLKKASKDERRAIEKGVKKLIQKIDQYAKDGIPFEKICNDDSVKYDILANNYFTLKAQSQQMPLRILYRFCRKDEDYTIEIHQSYQKKYADKRYMAAFEQYALAH